jgi:citrate lyase subunit gamma (acyl carrier protein)
MVAVSPAESYSLEYGGQNEAIFKRRTERIVGEISTRYGLSGTPGASVRIQDRGALEMTLRARVETAFERALKGDGEQEGAR